MVGVRGSLREGSYSPSEPNECLCVGWGVTLGHTDGPMPHLNSACREAVESASGVQILLPKEVAIVAYRHLSILQ